RAMPDGLRSAHRLALDEAGEALDEIKQLREQRRLGIKFSKARNNPSFAPVAAPAPAEPISTPRTSRGEVAKNATKILKAVHEVRAAWRQQTALALTREEEPSLMSVAMAAYDDARHALEDGKGRDAAEQVVLGEKVAALRWLVAREAACS